MNRALIPLLIGIIVGLLGSIVISKNAHGQSIETVAAVTGGTLLILDWDSSVWAVQHRYTENNKILGKHPTFIEQTLYTAAFEGIYYLGLKKLPKIPRYMLIASMCWIEGTALYGNLRVGAKLTI